MSVLHPFELPRSPDAPLLLHGDCLALMRGLPAASVDVVIADPPAGIGFMSKGWDSFAGYEPVTERGLDINSRLAGLLPPWAVGFVGFMTDVWVEVDRVLKPGGFVCAWALPKTADLAGLAMRAVGWTIHESLLHLFGCLTDDAEILTDIGWVHGRNVDQARLALCYDVESGTYEWQPIERTVRFPFSGTAYRVHGDGVDHTVTPDHRCVDIGPDGGRFINASEAASQPSIHVPVPDGLRGLRIDVASDGHMADPPSQDMQQGMCGQVDCAGTPGAQDATEALQDLRIALLAAEPSAELPLLLAPLLRAMEGDGPGHPCTVESKVGEGPCGLDRCEHGQLPAENVGPEQPGMEGRRHDAAQQGKLRGPPLCPMPAGVSPDGAQGRLRDGAPLDHGASARTAALADGVRASHESRSAGQPADQPCSVQGQPGSQDIRGSRGTTPVAARVEPVAYDGFMWCVTVKTGAFVARANGLPFVTGNSGFPKSHNVSKALDTLAGAEREVIGTRITSVVGTANTHAQDAWSVAHQRPHAVDITAPATPEAQRWDGWGTALAPGHEQWLLARKPTPLTYARQVLAHGCGAMNVGACLVGTSKDVPASWSEAGVVGFSSGRMDSPGKDPDVGRWPKNVLLTEGGDGCPVAELDRQSGHTASSDRARTNTAAAHNRTSSMGQSTADWTTGGHADAGGASRFFPRFKYQAKAHDRTAGLRSDVTNKHPTIKSVELMRWIVRLLAAKAEHTGGDPAIVLDPFMGSGTTGVACVAERVRFVGIERDPVQPTDHDSYGVACSRIMAAVGSPDAASDANERAPTGAQMSLL